MIRLLIDAYIFLLILDAILSYAPQFKNYPAVLIIRKLANYSCAPVRKLLPPDLPFDFSPIIVILLLNLFVALF
ncbi:MAG: YggT family protein [Deltaproteobacteria bacterium]|nr:MAG: YggT family protein [Deltaproteobacteria bacterium]TNF25404.1 MAG: YggT family protein [Deltaproteobacteria bacterium]